jgi:hypothetical protein
MHAEVSHHADLTAGAAQAFPVRRFGAKVSRSNFMFRGAWTPDVETTFSAAENEI